MSEQRRPFQPDSVSAPGEVIAELLDERGLTQRELADRMGRSEKTVNQIINGKAAITPETAAQLELVLGTPANYWLTHEAHYRAYLARQEQQATYSQWHPWLDRLPLAELMKQGAIPKTRIQGKNKDALVRQMLEFFRVASPVEWESVYLREADARVRWRIQRQRSDPAATATWLRLGEIAAREADLTTSYEAAALRALLPVVRSMTLESPSTYLPALVEQCARVGVVVALVPAIPRACVSGAARWLGGRPLIQMSLYGRTNDRFWFTFFHEAFHILEHSNRFIFLDEWDEEADNDDERAADKFTADFLIPPQHRLFLRTLRSEVSVRQFAAQVGVHPGIVVGRLQHEGIIPHKNLNALKQAIPRGAEHVH